MIETVFREYDIRGKVGTDFLIEEVYNLGCAIAYYFKQHNPNISSVALGMDGRTHSEAIKKELSRALCDSGLEVLFVGVCPSPGLYFALYNFNVDAGLMITASHNPAEYNGLKICLGVNSVWGAQVREIRTLYQEKKCIEQVSQKGSETERLVVAEYVAWLVNHFAHLKNMQISCVIDCGNGAGAAVIPLLIEKMGWTNVHQLYCTIDGTYPNHEADPVKKENMRDLWECMQKYDLTLGIGLDGDADRMVPMTESGFLVPGDQMLAIFSEQVVRDNPESAIVFDIKSSSALLDLLKRWHAKPCMSPSGHAIIKDQMRLNKAILGGELSAHFFFKDRYFGYDDGIYAMLRLLEILSDRHETLDNMLTVFPKRYSSSELRIACDEKRKYEILAHVKNFFENITEAEIITLDGIRVSFPDGWGIIRASNTQAVMSMRCEGYTPEGLQNIKDLFLESLTPFFDRDALAQQFNV